MNSGDRGKSVWDQADDVLRKLYKFLMEKEASPLHEEVSELADSLDVLESALTGRGRTCESGGRIPRGG